MMRGGKAAVKRLVLEGLGWLLVAGGLAALVLLALGVLWTWSPEVPAWWPTDERWWLPGGAATGITQVASALIALAMIVYSYRRFRVRGEDPSQTHANA